MIENHQISDSDLLMEYDNYPDEEMVLIMHDRYNGYCQALLIRILRSYFGLPVQLEDFQHLIYLSIKKSMAKFKKTNVDCSWQAFFVTRFKSDAQNYARKFISNKHKTINLGAEILPKKDISPSAYADSPAEIFKRKSIMTEIFKLELSKIEQKVIKLRMKEHNIREIATILKISYKQVDNALQRIRRKANHIF